MATTHGDDIVEVASDCLRASSEGAVQQRRRIILILGTDWSEAGRAVNYPLWEMFFDSNTGRLLERDRFKMSELQDSFVNTDR